MSISRWSCVAALLLGGAFAVAQQFNPALYQEMRWRCIGPFRAGRTVAIDGIPDRPNVFFMAATDGGVWKTDDFGRTWNPIFDGQPTGSVGALAVAPSNPDIIYVGSGEGLRRPDLSTGDGMYKTTDGGKTWTHLGLRDGQQIGRILVDPRDPNRIYVAVLGHPYGPNSERGVFRSADGGQTFDKILYKDENTGAIDLAFDPNDPQKIYAVMWASRRPPWSTGNALELPGSGLFKSDDGGDHWRQLTGGLPDWEHDKLGRIGITIAPSNGHRMYALVDSPTKGGLYRSDDAGENWQRINSEPRIWGRGSDFAWVRVSPKDENTIYVANTSAYKSTDGGQNFIAWKGAPGGDDYHSIWINPRNPDIILLGVDQGATLTVNGGRTWSSWYNQPTAQFYHVITDNQFPYWVYGGQQESGSAGIASRGNDGAITFRDWHPGAAEEYASIAPDPLDHNIIYGSPRGKVSRWHRDTGQAQDVTPAVLFDGKYRFNRTAPLIFSPKDPHTLFLGSNVLFKTTNAGQSWDVISPDLTRPDPGTPTNLGLFADSDPQKGKHRGVIYSVAPSPFDVNLIWIGTDDGLIQVTRDGGKSWQNVTPPEMTPWSKVAQLDAGHFDPQTAYAAVNRFRLDDLRPYIYRTHDGGHTWQKITNGLPDNASVNVVREDPERKGLLFAGTETSIWASFDDGDHWQSLQLNLPATSMRDLVVHGDDLVVGTHGRSFWILDDITPLRQLTQQVANSDVYLFKPEVAYRYRRDTYSDTPLPPEEPAGKNPPDGVVIDYYLKNNFAAGTGGGAQNLTAQTASDRDTPHCHLICLQILDSRGNLVRDLTGYEKPAPTAKELHVPTYWLRPSQSIGFTPGMHRFVWDMHYPPLDSLFRDYPISAIYHDTPLAPQGILAFPGIYTVTLTVLGRKYSQPLLIQEDPRVKARPSELQQQFEWEQKIADAIHRDYGALQQVRNVSFQLGEIKSRTQATLASSIQGAAQETNTQAGSLARLNGELTHVFEVIDGADAAPTTQAVSAFQELEPQLTSAISQWEQWKNSKLPALNQQLQQAGLPSLDVNKPAPTGGEGRAEE
ncbi:MAG TPA: glycoside hydrolase [Terriglobales bacterium]|nr:glycoside hydrolase [Terriglobales bacterium]